MNGKDLIAWCWYSVLRCPCWALAWFFFDFQSFGREHVPPDGPVLIVSNHQSNLDPVLVGLACSRQLKYLARHGLFFWPFSWLIRSLGAVKLEKKAGGLGGIKATLKLLREREAVLIFPEGSRTFDGELGPLMGGFCTIARRSGATIVPVAMDGAFTALPRGSAIPRPSQITVVIGPAIKAAELATLTDEAVLELTTTRISNALQTARSRK